MGKKKKIEKTQKYFMIVWARAQFLKFLRSRSRVWKKAALLLALTTWRARAQSAAQMSGAHQSFDKQWAFMIFLQETFQKIHFRTENYMLAVK